jgi:hypothetical protein
VPEVTTEDVIAHAAANYEAKRAEVQAAADADSGRQADVAAGLIQKPYVSRWDELSVDAQQWWLRESRRQLETIALAPTAPSPVPELSDDEQVAAYKATLPPEPTE